ncbi:protein serrate-like [Aricia agestis]|uniref:protein serrate-like n=1 Tax=Aricia agestis TaxID=91739 RepID=UPI001C209CED|nr:protein serrate-like [Aricia agestis]
MTAGGPYTALGWALPPCATARAPLVPISARSPQPVGPQCGAAGACGRARAGAPRPDPMRPRSPRRAPLLLALALACSLQCAAGAGVFELQVLEFSNYRLQLASGACCGGAPPPSAPPAACARACRTRFALCLKEYQTSAAPGACSFGRAASPVLGTDSFTLADPLYTLALPFSFRWTRSFTLILEAYDDSNYTEPETGLIEEAWWSGIVEPGAEWHALRHAGAAAAVAYRVRVSCQPNYYNTTCTTFCRPRDDKFGHYRCSPSGDKRCLPGWQGDNCEKPVCKEGCHPTHGRCDKPGECLCRPGWRGELCSQCQPYPGCKHGYCNGSSWDCTCDTNWGGILCDQDLNYCGTHEPCQHGGTCENTAPDQYLCTCAEGFSGADCERVDNPCAPQPCAHGSCSLAAAPAGFSCACERGWAGARCDVDVDDCASAPCRNGATCRDRLDGFVCECAPGWTGPTCVEDVDECAAGGTSAAAEAGGGVSADAALGPCVNAAACNNTAGGYACACLAGWTGRDCELNVDDCTGQCLNGATCIDLVDDFHCACAAGWAGRTCARDVDDCASRPCRNGGECVDLLDAYRCICPVGFSGTDCEDDRDHCAGAPCANGAECYTAQSDYYCRCAPGWTGKNCTLRALRDQSDACSPNPCHNGGSCVAGADDYACICLEGWTGERCGVREEARCEPACGGGGACVREGGGSARCACEPGWLGAACDVPASPPVSQVPPPTQIALAAGGCSCLHGACVATAAGGWACACRAGWAGARCESAVDGCASAPCRNGGRCAGGAGRWACECSAGWVGADCSVPSCDPPCPSPAVCATAPGSLARCVCPPPPARLARRCLELVAGLGEESGEIPDAADGGPDGDAGLAGADWPGACGADNGTWWWGCNACRCTDGAPACTRLWCGAPDCLAPGALPCRIEADEVCVPAPALCLRGPCAPFGECQRVAGRRLEAAALPAPEACRPGAGSAPPPRCARMQLRLARERLARGAHVERACAALRRALAAALVDAAPPAPPLALLCDVTPADPDVLDLALWVGEEEEGESAGALAAAVRALSELVARRRLAQHPLLGAALRLRVEAGARPGAAAAADAAAGASGPLLALAAVVPLLLLGAGAGALLVVRRRRAAAAERLRRRDEDKSNNLQNEENLRRYANPLREERRDAELPRAHSLYKAQNADARNNTPPRDKELTKRALPPPEPPPARHPPPERLTVLV